MTPPQPSPNATIYSVAFGEGDRRSGGAGATSSAALRMLGWNQKEQFDEYIL